MIEKKVLEDIINEYLWGQSKTPSSSELADNKFTDRDKNIILKINTNKSLDKTKI